MSAERPDRPGGRERDEAPSGMPADAEEAPPMGVPADEEADGDDELPGIPEEREPPSAG